MGQPQQSPGTVISLPQGAARFAGCCDDAPTCTDAHAEPCNSAVRGGASLVLQLGRVARKRPPPGLYQMRPAAH
jgi:hypothetical protein